MTQKTCFLIGHADAPEEIYPSLLSAVYLHIIQYGITEFFFGNHGNFDHLARRALTEAKNHHSQIRRILVLPYHPAQHTIWLPADIDESLYPFDEPVIPRFAIIKANRKMIDQCDSLIVYARHPGKARDYLEYAQRKNKNITRI